MHFLYNVQGKALIHVVNLMQFGVRSYYYLCSHEGNHQKCQTKCCLGDWQNSYCPFPCGNGHPITTRPIMTSPIKHWLTTMNFLYFRCKSILYFLSTRIFGSKPDWEFPIAAVLVEFYCYLCYIGTVLTMCCCMFPSGHNVVSFL